MSLNIVYPLKERNVSCNTSHYCKIKYIRLYAILLIAWIRTKQINCIKFEFKLVYIVRINRPHSKVIKKNDMKLILL